MRRYALHGLYDRNSVRLSLCLSVTLVDSGLVDCIGVGAQSTLGGTKFLPEKYVLKISKMPEFYIILARKIIKIP